MILHLFPVYGIPKQQSLSFCTYAKTEGLSEHFSAHAQALSAAIGARIRTRRLELNLSQERVRAQMELENVHVSRTQFSRVETGTILPNAAEIIALVNVLHVSSDWLLFGHAESPHDKM